ncbi:6-phosphogluconolactonase [Aquabacterium sp.]|uniref:6-phosphogluconolactonase n=1 Tax=Aquabacterium sp. TaxID=1872578 RepID=UPI0025C4DADC|nr:6-phosphogluconolactonase [Aquabacterium sp.]
MSFHTHQAPDAQTLGDNLARFVAARLRNSLAERGEALLIVSGGSTPQPFFKALAQVDLDWSKVTITLADDRWLQPHEQDSNERTVRTTLLQGPAAAANFVSLVTPQATPEEGWAEVERRLQAMPWPADVTIFGMGGDAHTASLFPNCPELPLALDDAHVGLSLPIGAPTLPNVPVPRLTLTRRALLHTHCAVLHFTGAAKWDLLTQANAAGPVGDMPIRIVLHQDAVPVHVFHAA